MKTSRYVVMAIAAVAAILLAFLVRGMIAGKATTEAKASIQAPAPVATQRVLVAAHEIKAGSRIAADDLTWQDWPATAINPSFIVDGAQPNNLAVATPGSENAAATAIKAPAVPAANNKAGQVATGVVQNVADKVLPSQTLQAYVGGVARDDILANEPIIDSKIVRADEGGFMAVMLDPGMRAMAVPVSVDNTAGGFILPGDRVDILVTHQTQKPGGGTIDSVQPVLRNIRVLAIDQQVSAEKDKQSVIGATATLAVTSDDGQALTLAKASGTLSLMLRSYADASGPSGVINSRPVGSEADASIRVFRNGQTSEVVVSR